MKFARGKRTSDASPTSSQASLLHSKPRAVPCIIDARCRSLSSAHVLSHVSAHQLAGFCGGHIHASGPRQQVPHASTFARKARLQ